MSEIVAADSALTPHGDIAPFWLRHETGRIVESGPGRPPRHPDIHFKSGVLAPGFVDVHAHGGAGAAFTEGADAARSVLAAHRSRGTTTMLASLVSADMKVILSQVDALAGLVDSGELAGIHLEGPWLDSAHRGAHGHGVLSDPDPAAISAVLEHPSRAVRYVTIAPERAGAMEAIGRLRDAGVVVGVGHTGADCATTRQALASGATAATHLFNGMKGMHHRDPGAALALLEDPQAFLELIVDGVHLHPEMVRFVWNTAGRRPAAGSVLGVAPVGAPVAGTGRGEGRIVLVSDAMAAAMAQDGLYLLGSLRVEVRQGTARLLTGDGTPGAIAGSTVSLADAVRTAIRDAGIAPERALPAASSTPAAMIGLDDVGVLTPGARADAVLLDDSWAVRRVLHRGYWLPAESRGGTGRGLWDSRSTAGRLAP